MSKGFGVRRNPFDRHKQQVKHLKQRRDRVLGLAWLGYLSQAIGAVRLTKTRDGKTIDYIPRRLIDDAVDAG